MDTEKAEARQSRQQAAGIQRCAQRTAFSGIREDQKDQRVAGRLADATANQLADRCKFFKLVYPVVIAYRCTAQLACVAQIDTRGVPA